MITEYNLETQADVKLSEHFKVKEFINPQYTKKGLISSELVNKLENARKIINKPIHITPNGGYRTSEQNENQGGAKNSNHLKGLAVDTYVDGISNYEWAIILAMAGFSGIGIYKWGVHADIRPEKIVFKIEGIK